MSEMQGRMAKGLRQYFSCLLRGFRQKGFQNSRQKGSRKKRRRGWKSGSQFDMEWGGWVKRRIREMGWSQRKVALAAGMDPSYMTLICQRGFVPSRVIVERLGRALGVDPDQALVRAGYAPKRLPERLLLHPELMDAIVELIEEEENAGVVIRFMVQAVKSGLSSERMRALLGCFSE